MLTASGNNAGTLSAVVFRPLRYGSLITAVIFPDLGFFQ